MLPKSPSYIFCNFNWCYTSKNYSSFKAIWMVSILHFAVEKCPEAHMLESGLNLWEEWVQRLSTELSKFFPQFLFWNAVQPCCAVLSLGDFSAWKTLFTFKSFLSLPEIFPDKGTATHQMPSGISNSNYLHEWDFKTLRFYISKESIL